MVRPLQVAGTLILAVVVASLFYNQEFTPAASTPLIHAEPEVATLVAHEDPPEAPLGEDMAEETKTVTSSSNVGTGDTWSNLTNIAAEDGSTVDVSLSGGSSKRLRCVFSSNPFAIPSGSDIDGITVTIRRRTFSIGGALDSVIQLTSGGSSLGTNKSAGAAWPIILADATYGGSSDEWGRTWSSAEINSTDFGVDIACTGSSDAAVDVVDVTITYSLGSGAPTDPANVVMERRVINNPDVFDPGHAHEY